MTDDWDIIPLLHNDEMCNYLEQHKPKFQDSSISDAIVVITYDPRDACLCGVWTVIRQLNDKPSTWEMFHVTGTKFGGYYGTKREAIGAAFNRDLDDE